MPNSSSERGTFAFSTGRLTTAPTSWKTFEQAWNASVAPWFPRRTFTSPAGESVHGHTRAVRLGDALATDYYVATGMRTHASGNLARGQVRLQVVRRGNLRLRDPQTGNETAVKAGEFILMYCRTERQMDAAPGTSARTLTIVSDTWPQPHQPVVGKVTDPALRILLAHQSMIQQTHSVLGPAAREAAGKSLLELMKGLPAGQVDDQEPIFAPTLIRAAQTIALRQLERRELSTASIADELNVSLRSLQRAFAAQGEPLSAFIRARRLEAAAQSLVARSPSTVSQAGAQWHFSDTSHFIRAFKQHFGCTPTEYRRAH